MTTIVCRDTKDLQPHPRALPIISIRKIDHMVDLKENPDLQVRGQGLDLQEICTEFRIQGSPGLDLLGKIETERQNHERSRSRSPRNIPHRLLKSRRSRSPEVRSTFQPSRDPPTYSRNTLTPNGRISSGKSVPSASTLNRHFPMEEGRK